MKTFNDYIQDIIDFFRKNNVTVDPEPIINLDNTPVNRFDPFIPTGSYDFISQTITLYISQRQCKDILRSFCHELIHHSQYISNPKSYKYLDKTGKLSENSMLKKYEQDAYTRGNLLFRAWTEETTL